VSATTSIDQSGRDLIVEFLLQEGKLTEKDVQAVYEIQRKDGCRIERALVLSRVVADTDIASIYSAKLHVPLMQLDMAVNPPPQEVIDLLPEKFLRDALVIPLQRKGGDLQVAVVDPSDLSTLHDVQLYSGSTPIVFVTPLLQAERALEHLFGARNVVSEISLEARNDDHAEDADVGEDIIDLDRPIIDSPDTQIIRMVNHVVRQAIEERASDIHIEPLAESVAIRFRIDGSLQARPAPPKKMFLPLLSRLKVISKMDIAEKRLAQDGAFSVLHNRNQIDMRVSAVPTVHGQKMVIRILNKDAQPLDLEKLGFNEKQRECFNQGANQPHGLIFVTGPTGSGKSTTLYATLKLLNDPTTNIVTVEDPVEYKMDGVNQVQVHSVIGLTFASALRAFLRQDPDVIMVGEVRDQETAEICMRAALTGHLVLSTLHTNSALSAIDRLVDMGIEPFMVASTMRLVEAQRLIRRLCVKCKRPYDPDPKTREKYKILPEHTVFQAAGCETCNGTGYRGRVGIFEVITITPALRDMIQKRAPLSEMQEQAEKEGMASLMTNALEKVRAGITSLDEAVTAIMEGSE
jgi:type IV pilus assembly protein PilB